MTLSFKFGDPREDFLRKRNVYTSRYEDYFLDDAESDLTIRFDDLSVPGHSFVFEERCPTMYDYYGMGEGYSEIHIDDVEFSEETILTILRFIYRGDIVFRADDLTEILLMAHYYDIDDLYNRLTSGPNFEELWKDYAWSFVDFVVTVSDGDEDENRVHGKVWDRIEKNAEALIGLDGFSDLPADTIRKVLRRNDLRAYETSLFNACLQWASVQCGRRNWKDVAVNWRKLMQPFIHSIRFPLMSLSEFQSGPKTSGVVHLHEVRAIENAIESGRLHETGFDNVLRARPEVVRVVPNQQHGPTAVRVGTAPQSRAEAPTAGQGETRNLCKVCLAGEIGILFQPCGHVVVCRDCSANLSDCPVCRKTIAVKIRAFLS